MSATHTGIDLLIIDVLENLLVPVNSSSAIPDWNRWSEDYFKVLFTLRFFIKVYACPGSQFSITDSKTWLDLGFSLEGYGLLQNFTDKKNQLMCDQVPCGGAREKHSSFIQIIIESLTKEGDIVMDWQAGIGVPPSIFL